MVNVHVGIGFSMGVGLILSCTFVRSFNINPLQRRQSPTELRMGLFDGVREAFSAPALEKSAIDKDRETPIDRWMGWSVKAENEQQEARAGKVLNEMNFACNELFHLFLID
jgi:hypothetical protein